MKQIHEMTYQEWYNNKYQYLKTKYPKAKEEDILNTIEMNKKDWTEALIEASQNIILSDEVIDSYVTLYGKNDLLRTFRGIYAKGISQWEPIDVRLYDKSYQWMLNHRNELGLLKGQVKQFYNRIMDRAIEQEKIARSVK